MCIHSLRLFACTFSAHRSFLSKSRIHMHTYIFTQCICMHTYAYMHTYICIHTYAYIHMHTYICMHTYAYIHMHSCMYVYRCVFAHVARMHFQRSSPFSLQIIHTYACINMHTYKCIHACTCIHVFLLTLLACTFSAHRPFLYKSYIHMHA